MPYFNEMLEVESSDLRIRKLDERVVAALRLRAKHKGYSLEAELRETLQDEVKREKRAIVAEHVEMLKKLRDKYGTFSDSAVLIRDERDTRG
jgi:plasmid stability protein